MSKFERTYEIDPSREQDHQREIQSIELSDRDHLIRLGVKFDDDPLYVKFNDKPLYESTTIVNESPNIEMPSDSDILIKHKISDKVIKGIKDAKSPSKSTKGKPKKNHSKANTAAVESIQS